MDTVRRDPIQHSVQHSAFSIQHFMKSIIVHYSEIALKGKNRPWFVSRLVRNIREATADLDVRQVRALQGRIEVVLADGATGRACAIG